MSTDSVSNRQVALLLAWLIATVALIGTLYASEIKDFPICLLCWYQRVCIYPLFIILGIGAFKDDSAAAIYSLPLTTLGFLFALYQYLEQMIPGFSPIEVCSNGPRCNETHMQFLGFITFPFLSMIACMLIAILTWIALKARR